MDDSTDEALGKPNWTAGTAGAGDLNEPKPNLFKPTEPKTPAEPVPDTKEQHIEAIRWLIGELSEGADALVKHKLDQISTRLDAIEDKKTEKTVKW